MSVQVNDPIKFLDEQPGPTGLGGWLILMGIGVVIGPLAVLFAISQIVKAYQFASATPGLSVALTLELIMQIGFFVFGLYAAYLFFNKKAQFPKLQQILLIASVVAGVLDTAIVSGIGISMQPSDIKEIAKSIIVCAIWIPYLRVSKRVKNTFVEP